MPSTSEDTSIKSMNIAPSYFRSEVVCLDPLACRDSPPLPEQSAEPQCGVGQDSGGQFPQSFSF